MCVCVCVLQTLDGQPDLVDMLLSAVPAGYCVRFAGAARVDEDQPNYPRGECARFLASARERLQPSSYASLLLAMRALVGGSRERADVASVRALLSDHPELSASFELLVATIAG